MDVFDKRQFEICVETIRNPLKGIFLGGPSEKEAKEILTKKFKLSNKQEKIKKEK